MPRRYFGGMDLAPFLFIVVMNCTAILLLLFVLLSPTLILHGLSFFVVTSTTGENGYVIGLLGSCSRTVNNTIIKCTKTSIRPAREVGMSTVATLFAPTGTLITFVVALAFSTVFFVLSTLILWSYDISESDARGAYRRFTRRQTNASDRRNLVPALRNETSHRRLHKYVKISIVAVGLIGFITTVATFIAIRIDLSSRRSVFQHEQSNGISGPLIVSTGFSTTLTWIAFAFQAVPALLAWLKTL